MTTIGTFTKQQDGFSGTLRTLTVNVKIKIVPIAKDSDKAPDYRVFAGVLEIGAGWKRQTAAKRDYVSVKLDDPAFAAPLNARLIDAEDGTPTMYWTRPAED